MAPIKAFLLSILVSLGFVEKPKTLVTTAHTTIHQGTFTVSDGDTLLQVSTAAGAKTRVTVEKCGNTEKITINSD